jgi:surface protein
MKIKTLFGVGLVLTSLLVSCSNEDLLQGNQNAGSNTLTAYIESQNDSRVSISDEGKFAWSDDDKISVASTSDNFETWSLSKINDDGSADFTSSSTVSDDAYAVFPETLNPSVSDDGALQLTLPAEYESNKTVPILIGKYNDGKVDFAHVGGLIRISFANVPSSATKVVFTTNGQNITGGFTVDDDNAINTTDGENSAVTINIADGDNVDGSMTFDIPVPVGEYKGFIISIYSGDNLFISQSTSEAYTIERRDLLVMPTISLPTNYVIETIKPSSADDETYVLDKNGGFFDKSQVVAVYIDGKKQAEVACSYAFGDTEVHSVTIVMSENFTSAYGMFFECAAIISLDLSHLDTSNVTNMRYMFDGCTGLTSLDLSHLDTSNVTDMNYMFYGCTGITSLDLSHLDTSSVTEMKYLFRSCSSLTSLDLSHLDTSKVTNMRNMFYRCYSLTTLDLSHFDTSNVTDMRYMFKECSTLVEIKMTGDIKDGVNTGGMFDSVPTLGTFYYPASKKEQYAKFFDGTGISEWKQVDTETGEEIIKDAGSTDTDGDNGETDATSDSN